MVFAVLVAAAGYVGSAATLPTIPTWYAGLAKPAWTPPNAVFGPAWTILYLMIAVAAWLVWRRAGWARGSGAMLLWLVQLVLNTLWSVLFFGLHMVPAAMAEIVLMWIAIAATIVAFRRHARAAAWLLVPYLLWVTYAASLNAGVWWLNR
jgi:tryptophan-rich sensory protein